MIHNAHLYTQSFEKSCKSDTYLLFASISHLFFFFFKTMAFSCPPPIPKDHLSLEQTLAFVLRYVNNKIKTRKQDTNKQQS